MKQFSNKTIGEIVAQNIEYARVFNSFGIDFCCGGNIFIEDAAKNASVPLDKIIEALNNQNSYGGLPLALNFDNWSLELLINYIVKYHHHYIRNNGPRIYNLLDKVVKVHSETDKHLPEVLNLFRASLMDLDNHLAKEENILFPLVTEIVTASERGDSLPKFHCGSVQNPIRVMLQEHEDEGARFKRISELTNFYTAPKHACNSYKLVLKELKQFEENLHIHIHVENNILFKKSIIIEESLS